MFFNSIMHAVKGLSSLLYNNVCLKPDGERCINFQVEDFVDPTGRISLIHEEIQSCPRAEAGIFSSFYNYLTLAQDTPAQKVLVLFV